MTLKDNFICEICDKPLDNCDCSDVVRDILDKRGEETVTLKEQIDNEKVVNKQQVDKLIAKVIKELKILLGESQLWSKDMLEEEIDKIFGDFEESGEK